MSQGRDPFDEALALARSWPSQPPRPDARPTDPPRPDDDEHPGATRTSACEPDAARPDSARPNTARSNTPQPDTPQPDTAQPDTHTRAPHPATPHSATLHTWREARAAAHRAARALPPVTLDLADALHHVLAAPLPARTDLPSFDTSAMDGWAVAGPGPWELPAADSLGILAGQDGAPSPLPDGHAIPIATGARIPPGATAVLRSEDAQIQASSFGSPANSSRPPASGSRAQTTVRRLQSAGAAPTTGADIRPRGQECRSGDVLLPAGTLVTPVVLGLAAAAGYDELTVIPRPRVEILVLGEELLHSGAPRDGRIRDALGPMLPSWLAAFGAGSTAVRRLGDDAEALRQAVTTSSAELLVTTGGTAAGPVDHLHATLRQIGAELLVDGVAVRPGRPMLLARLRSGQHLVGLPGNPLAAVSGLLTLAGPLVRRLADRPESAELPAVSLTEGITGHSRDIRLVPVVVSRPAGTARPLRYTGPAMLRGIATATDLAVIPPSGVSSGQRVRLLELPWT